VNLQVLDVENDSAANQESVPKDENILGIAAPWNNAPIAKSRNDERSSHNNTMHTIWLLLTRNAIQLFCKEHARRDTTLARAGGGFWRPASHVPDADYVGGANRTSRRAANLYRRRTCIQTSSSTYCLLVKFWYTPLPLLVSLLNHKRMSGKSS